MPRNGDDVNWSTAGEKDGLSPGYRWSIYGGGCRPIGVNIGVCSDVTGADLVVSS